MKKNISYVNRQIILILTLALAPFFNSGTSFAESLDEVVQKAKSFEAAEALGEFRGYGRGPFMRVGPGKITGKDYVYLFYYYYGGNMDVLVVDPDNASFEKSTSSESGIGGAVVGSDRNIYLGTNPGGKILKYNTSTGALEEIGKPVATESFILSLDGYADNEDHIYGGTAFNAHLIDIDVSRQQTVDLGKIDAESSHASTPFYSKRYDSVYVTAGTKEFKLIRYDVKLKSFTSLDLPSELKNVPGIMQLYRSAQDNICVKCNNRYYYVSDKDLLKEAIPVGSYCSWTYRAATPQALFSNGSLLRSGDDPVSFKIADLINGVPMDKRTVRVDGYDGSISDAYSIGQGSDGNIYISGALPANVWKYDKRQNKFSLIGTGNQNFIGQFYNIISLGSKTYLTAYGKSRILEFDPQKPFFTNINNYKDPANNPIEVANGIDFQQDRPVATIALSDGRLAVGSVPNYGVYGGAMSIYDPIQKTQEVFRGLYPNHSIVSLLEMPGGILIGGSSKEGGTGAPTPPGDAGILFFNLQNKVLKGSPMVVPGAARITNLIRIDEDRFIGAAYLQDGKSQLFIGSASVKGIVKFGDKFSGCSVLNGALVRGRNGFLYGLASQGIIVVDPENLRYQFIEKRNIRSGFVYEDGMLYFSDSRSGKLFRKRVLEPFGDFSRDGEITAYDAALATKIAARGNWTAEELKRGDVNGDGKIDGADIALIAKKAVGLIDRFPAGG